MKFLNTYHTCSYTENFALNKYDCYYSFENKWRRSIGGNRRYNEGAYYYHINLSRPRSDLYVLHSIQYTLMTIDDRKLKFTI